MFAGKYHGVLCSRLGLISELESDRKDLWSFPSPSLILLDVLEKQSVMVVLDLTSTYGISYWGEFPLRYTSRLSDFVRRSGLLVSAM